MPESPGFDNEIQLRRSPELLSRDRSQLLIVDVQEKLLPVIHDSDRLLKTVRFIMDVAKVLQVPAVISEQYPQGLGGTVAQIAEQGSAIQTFDKLRFSASEGFLPLAGDCREPGGRDQVVIVGIEAHVCVLQTAFDLLACGLRAFVVADAVGSRNPADYHRALDRIRDAGGVVCTAESVAFEWCEVAGTDEFRQVSRLVRNRGGR